MRAALLTILTATIAVSAGSMAAQAAAVEYTGAAHRDPFKSQLPVKQPAKTEEKLPIKNEPVTVDFLTVSGVVWNSERPQAIINGKVVTVGSEVGGAEVVAISEAQVQVRYKGQLFVLKTGNKKGGQP